MMLHRHNKHKGGVQNVTTKAILNGEKPVEEVEEVKETGKKKSNKAK